MHGVARRLNGTSAGVIDRLQFGLNGTQGQSSIQWVIGPNTVSLAGTTYLIDTDFEPYRREAFRHRSIPDQRESLNYDNVPGQSVVNTAGNWRRDAVDWSLGAGQLYFDHKESSSSRFYQSKGVNPWNQWQLSLQQATTLSLGIQGSRTNQKALAVGKYQYFMEDDKITFIDVSVGYGTVNTVNSPPATGAGHYFTDICSNGEFVFVACGTNGIYYWPVGDTSTAGTHYVSCTGSWTTVDRVAWAADALWAAGGKYLFLFGASAAVAGATSLSGTTASQSFTAGNITANQVIPVVVGANWRWTNIVQGNSQIYVGGYNLIGGKYTDGAVYRVSQVLTASITGSAATTSTTFSAPIKSLQLPSGEYPTALFAYLNYVFVGTNVGVRLCETLNIYDPTATGTGDLKSGPYVPNVTQPITSPVTSFTAQGRYVYFAWANYDGTSTGLGRLDISNFVDDLNPAYASDLMVTAQGTTLNLTWDVIQNAPLISVSAPTTGTAGTYSSDPANLVTSGYVDSGWITYGIPDNKTLVAFHPDVITSAGEITAAILADVGNGSTGVFNQIADDTSTNNTLGTRTIIDPFITGVQFRNKITLKRQSATSGPVLARWTLEGFPQISSETLLTPVLELSRRVLSGGQEGLLDPYAEYFRLDTLRRSKTPVTYVEGVLSALVLIDSIDWLPERLQEPAQKGYNSLAVVSLKTLNGFTYSPIPTHF